MLDTANVYNLEDFGCPHLEILYDRYCSSIQRCIYHKDMCAYKNVHCLYSWYKDNYDKIKINV